MANNIPKGNEPILALCPVVGQSQKRQRAEQLRKKRAQAVSVRAQGAKTPPKAIPVPTRPRRPPSAARGG